MSRPRLSIRRKLLGLLALFSLCPLLILAYFDHRAFDRFGASLAAEWGASLSAQARRSLAAQADTGALLLTHAVDRLAYAAQAQARLVARELVNQPASPAAGENGRRPAPSAIAAADAERSNGAARLQAVAGELAALREALGLDDSLQEVRLTGGLRVQFPASQREFPRRAGIPADLDAPSIEVVASADTPWLVVTRPLLAQTGENLGTSALATPLSSLLGAAQPAAMDTTLGHALLVQGTGSGVAVLAGDTPVLQQATPGQIQTLRRELATGESGQRLLRLGESEVFCLYRPLPSSLGHVLWLAPANAATSTARAAANYALASARRQGDAVIPMILTAGLVVALVAAYAARSVTQPVSQLKRVMEAVAGGDFAARVRIDTGDELEGLGHTFNRMIPQLAEEARLQQSMLLAREVQQRMLPANAPAFPGVEVAGLSRYCEQTGGDYFDYLDGRPLGRQMLGVAIGDVAGHGVPAALLMTTARALLHGLLAAGVPPAQILQQLNLQLSADVRPGHFMTLLYLLVDVDRQQLVWASAGHEPALWWHAETGEVTLLNGEDIPLGVDADWQFKGFAEAPYQPGDALLLVTDGLCETRNPAGDAFGRQRLSELFCTVGAGSADSIASSVLGAVDDFMGGGAAHDDQTIVVVRLTHTQAG